MRRCLPGLLALALMLGAPAIGMAAGEDLVALWNTPEGTLEIKDDGTFAGKPKDMDARLPASGKSTPPACWC